jgi:hypothetical protein
VPPLRKTTGPLNRCCRKRRAASSTRKPVMTCHGPSREGLKMAPSLPRPARAP